MNPTIYKQLDSRWSSKPYPTKASSFGGNGCGCCACTHIAMEQTDKANWTPENLRQWMINQGFAYAGKGTTWQGITATLEYIGHGNVVRVWSDPMSVAFAELEKGNRIGVFLFSAGYGGTDKIYWTAGGHYVAFTDSKYENGDWWFYCKDSGGRNHDGWFSYTKHIRGVVAKVWLVERLEKVEPKPYSGEFPTLGTSQAEICQATSKGKSQWHRTWVYTSKSTSAYHWTRVIRPNKNGDKIAEDMLKAANNGHIKYSKKSNTLYAAASKVGFDCGRITADKNTHCSNLLCVALHYAGFTNAPKSLHAGKAWTYLSKLGFSSLTNTAYTHSPDLLRVGDILQAEGCPHVAVVTKAKGASVLKKGSKGDEVLKLQKYINWFYGKKVVDEDGIFGAGTEKYTTAMQTALGVTPDGIVGSGTLAKMKEYKK